MRNRDDDRDQRPPEGEPLLVLEDLDNRFDYYMSVVDRFPLGDRDYIVLTNYEPEDGHYRAPDFVLMRVHLGTDGQQYYESIRDQEELNIVFETFFERMRGDLLGEA